MLALLLIFLGSLCRKPAPQIVIERITTDVGDDTLSLNPCIVSDNSGRVVLAWTRYRFGKEDIWYTERDAGGNWSQHINLSRSGTGDGSRRVSLCFDRESRLHAAWSQYANGWVIVYTWREHTGIWATPETVRHAVATLPHIGVDTAGRVHLVFSDMGSGTNPCYTSRSPSGVWDPVKEIRSGYKCLGEAVLYVHLDGTCSIGYIDTDSANILGKVDWVSRAGDSWTQPSTLDSLTPAPMALTMAGIGDTALLGYVRGGFSPHSIGFWTRGSLGSWSGPETLCPVVRLGAEPAFAVTASGDVMAAWTEVWGTNVITAAKLSSTWTEGVVFAGTDSTHPLEKTACASPDGVFHVAWRGGTAGRSAIYYASVRFD